MSEINTIAYFEWKVEVVFREATYRAERDNGTIDRKAFALFVNERYGDIAPYLFARLDGKDIVQMIYEREDFSNDT